MPTDTPPKPNMDESWASLDVSDFSHDDDDDTESVNTDGGSLVDLSSVHDTESAAEDESQSEMGIDDERESVANMLRRGLSRHAEQVGQPDQQEVSPYDATEDTIIFQKAATQRTSSAIDMEYVRDVSWTSNENSNKQTTIRETINMAISPNDLTSFDAPVKIYYYGSQKLPHSRDELLGKIGAALLTPSSNSSSRTSTASTCFNIVPTEFGPGSKPAFADLIPSQAQMTVDEISAVEYPSVDTRIARFATARGLVVESNWAFQPGEVDCRDLHPDLLVILLTDENAEDNFEQLYDLIGIATRHCWPTIVVEQGLSVSPHDPRDFRNADGINIYSPDNQVIGIQRPIDLDSFVAMDTVQLSRYIMHLMEEKMAKQEADKVRAEQTESLMDTIYRHLIWGGKGEGRWFLKKVDESKSGSPSNPLPEPSLSEEVKQAWSRVAVRQRAKDIMFTLIVMMLGIYIVGFSQNLSAKVNGLLESDNCTTVSSKTQETATVTATSAITAPTNTAVITIDQDVAVYDPILFDQVWQRLTGRAIVDQEGEKAPKEVVVEDVMEKSVEASKESDVVRDRVDQLAGWFQSKLDTVRMRAQQTVPQPLESLNKLKKQVEVQELHQKLHDFYKDVTTNVPKMGLARQGYLHNLVTRSQHHLQQAQWAGEKRLERLIAEQKTLLSHAQHQAQNIVAAKKKRRSIFGRGQD